MNIDLKMSPAEIAFAVESIREYANNLMTRLSETGLAIVEKQEFEKQRGAQEEKAGKEYVNHLESLVHAMQEENKKLASAAVAKPKAAPKKRGRPAKAKAPWGYKKDGTPKKRPGRKVGDF